MSRVIRRVIRSNYMTEPPKEKKRSLSDLKMMFLFLGLFYSLAIYLWIVADSIFYLINFIIIGSSLGFGMGLWPVLSKKNKDAARKLSQALVGSYLFFGLGFGLIYVLFGYILPENMQFEGFWFMLLAGMTGAGVLHYMIAKITGPILTHRGWCGWACWTAAVLDYLPWQRSPGRLPKKWGYLRYVIFVLSTSIVLISMFVFGLSIFTNMGVINLAGIDLPPDNPINVYQNLWEIPEFWWFLVGNVLYFGSGIILAYVLKDNRAFCKYLCPITVFLKAGARVSIVKVKADPEKCNQCLACERDCPMDILITGYTEMGSRVTSSECILCMKCISACSQDAISISAGLDIGRIELLRTRENQS